MRLLLFLVVLILASMAGIYIAKDPGYAFFQYEGWVIEMPLWVVVLSVVAVFFLMIFIWWLIQTARRVLGFGPRWLSQHKLKSANHALEQSLMSISEGNWQQAERFSAKSIAYSQTPLVAFLQAAKAAQEQGQYGRRDQYLQQAIKALPDAVPTLLLSKAQFQFQAGHWEESLATLDEIEPHDVSKAALIQLRCMILQKLQRWEDLEKLFKQKKTNVLPETQREALHTQTVVQRLQQVANQEGKQGLLHYWQHLPRATRKTSSIVYEYAVELKTLGLTVEAEKLVRDHLKKDWYTPLVALYGELKTEKTLAQIQTAEGWLKSHPDDGVLLLCLARLCLHHRLWGKARAYLEHCIEIAPSTTAYAELGRLLGYLGEQQQSFTCYQKGLSLATGEEKDAK